MSEEQNKKIIEGIALATLNSFNINGLINAGKFYAMHLAQERFQEMSEEDRKQALQEIEEQENKSKEQAES
jgi:hypothetical protein